MSFFRFPYTNLHEINLDWILKEVKKFAELIPDMESASENVQQALDDSAEALETANEAKYLAEQASQAIVADGSITTNKLADGAVTSAKIDTGAVTSAKLANSAVTTTKINNLAVTEQKLANEAVTSGKIKDGNVTYAKLGNDAKQIVLWFTDVVCSAMTGNFAEIADASITADHVVAKVEFADPSKITTPVSWTTGSGTLALNGTCSGATTCSVLLVRNGNV